MLGLELLAKHAVRQFLRQQDPVSGDKPAGLSEPAMTSQKVGTYQTVAVEEHDVIAGRCANSAISYLASAEAAMLMPDVRERHAYLHFVLLNHGRRVRRRAIIGHEDLEVPVLLRLKRAEYGRERVFAVVCGDHDGDQPVHYPRPFSQAFM